MEIRIKTPKAQSLCTLKAGDCFEKYGDFYIVTDERANSQREVKCVNLQTGSLENLFFDTDVYKLDTILTLRRIGEET